MAKDSEKWVIQIQYRYPSNSNLNVTVRYLMSGTKETINVHLEQFMTATKESDNTFHRGTTVVRLKDISGTWFGYQQYTQYRIIYTAVPMMECDSKGDI